MMYKRNVVYNLPTYVEPSRTNLSLKDKTDFLLINMTLQCNHIYVLWRWIQI